ncbi:MAG: hypothetical protein DI538_22075 [Azospira oryzae]|jgi:O-acetyl-ADP-ribose deacetylase (regulator of RNase III)|nr:MAG: hypothetical protein DI538_22075 [Azospira oryzae]
MQTYHIHCTADQQAAITEILRRDHDVIINQATPEYIGITIEKDKNEADPYYQNLIEKINRELHLAVH